MENLQLQDVSGSIGRLALLALLCLLSAGTLVCGNGSVPTITVEELARMASDSTSSLFLLDVRTNREYLKGHLGFADLRIPYDSLDANSGLLPDDKSTPIYCFCRTGRRSGIAARRLIEMGYQNVFNVDGGIRGWTAAGYEIVGEKPDSVSSDSSAATIDSLR